MDQRLKIKTVKVAALDTGLGREAGYRNDTELIAAAKAERTQIEEVLTPEAFARIEAAEADAERRFLFGG